MERPLTTTTDQSLQIKQDISKLLPQLQNGMELLPMFKTKTALEVIRSNKNCLSGLSKLSGKMATDMALMRLLKEVFSLTLSPASDHQLASMASQIRENFYFLRFEEIQYVFNKGINSHYGVSNKNLAYDTISFWLTEYQETERLAAVTERNEENKETIISRDEIPDELLYLDAKYTGRKIEPELTPEQKLKRLDDQQWTLFCTSKDSISMDDLHKLLAQTTESGLIKTAESIQREIDKRK